MIKINGVVKSVIFILILVVSIHFASADSFSFSNMQLITTYSDYAPANSIEGARGMQYDTRGILWIAATTDDSLTGIRVYNPTSLSTVYSSVNDGTVPGTVDNIWFFSIDNAERRLYTPSFTDDAISIWNVSTTSFVLINGTATISNNLGTNKSLDQIYDNAYVDVGSSRFCVASASVDDTLSVYNCTNGNVPVGIESRVTAANPCTTDDLRKLYNIPGTAYILAASLTDDAISTFQILSNGSISCISNYTSSAGTYSIDALQDFYYEEETKLLYVPGGTDDTLTILNATNLVASGGALTTVGGITNATGLNAIVSVTVGKIGNEKFAFLGSSSAAAADLGIMVVNVTNPAAPVFMGRFTNAAPCNLTTVYSLDVIDNYLFATSGSTTTMSCLYSIKLFNYTAKTPTSYYGFENWSKDDISGWNGTDSGVDYVSGFLNSSASFLGADGSDVITINASVINTTNFTINFWYKSYGENAVGSCPADCQGYIIADGNAGNMYWRGYGDNDAAETLNGDITGHGSAFTISNTVPLNTWTMLTMTHTTDDWRIYQNGTVIYQGEGSTFTGLVTSLLLGDNAALDRELNGSIDEMGIWSGTVLTHSEINDLYNNYLLGIRPVNVTFNTSTPPSYNISDYSYYWNGTSLCDEKGGLCLYNNFSSQIGLNGSFYFNQTQTQRIVNLSYYNSICSKNNNFSVSLWFYGNAFSFTDTLFHCNGANDAANYFAISAHDSGTTLRAGVFDTGSSWLDGVSSGVLNNYSWYHVVVTWNGSIVSMYLNNVSQSGTSTPTSSTTIGWSIGASVMTNPDGTPYYPSNGYIDDVKIFNRTLSAAEASLLYAANRTTNGTLLVGTLTTTLTYPLNTIYVISNRTFYINGTISCAGDNCYTVRAYAMYNTSSANPDTPIPTALDVLYINSGSPNTTNPVNQSLSVGQSYTVSWLINKTGVLDYYIHLYANSSETSVTPKNTSSILVKTALPINNLVLEYSFENSLATDTCSQQNGTITGSLDSTSCVVGDCYDNFTDSDYITVPDSTVLDSFSDAITICLWAKDWANSTWQNAISRYSTTDNQRGWMLQDVVAGTQTNGYDITFGNETGTATAGATASANYTADPNIAGQWQFACASWNKSVNSGIPEVFINGTEVSDYFQQNAKLDNINPNLYVPLTIGRANYTTGRYVRGLIDEVTIWDRKLTTTEIDSLYNYYLNDIRPTDIQACTIAEATPYLGSNVSFNTTFDSGSLNSATIVSDYRWNLTFKVDSADCADIGTDYDQCTAWSFFQMNNLSAGTDISLWFTNFNNANGGYWSGSAAMPYISCNISNSNNWTRATGTNTETVISTTLSYIELNFTVPCNNPYIASFIPYEVWRRDNLVTELNGSAYNPLYTDINVIGSSNDGRPIYEIMITNLSTATNHGTSYYQEDADETTCTDNFCDGSTATSGGYVTSYMNYTKPQGATGATWNVWDATDEFADAVPSSCWNYLTDKLMFQASLPGGESQDLYYCRNSTGWQQMYEGLNAIPYEESITWSGSDITTYSLNNNSLKTHIIVVSGQHASETYSDWVTEGMMRFLLNTTDANATLLRNNFVFYFYPVLNPDGRYEGFSRYTPEGIDMNRAWDDNGSLIVNITRARILTINSTIHNISMIIDQHGNGGTTTPITGSSFFGFNSSFTTNNYYDRQTAYVANLSYFTDTDDTNLASAVVAGTLGRYWIQTTFNWMTLGYTGEYTQYVTNNVTYIMNYEGKGTDLALLGYFGVIAAPTDTCTYSGSGNWVINDHCNMINTNYNVAGYVLINTTGWLNISGTSILNATGNIRWYPKDAEESFRLRWYSPAKVRWT